MSERRATYDVDSPGVAQGGNGTRVRAWIPPKPVPLTGGSLKQVQWAERIRRGVLRMVPQALADELAQVRAAQFWITHRERTPEQWLGITAREGPSLFRVESPRYTRDDGLDWARRLDPARCVMVDTETTGLGVDDEIIEVAIVRLSDRAVFMNTLVRPTSGLSDASPHLLRAPCFSRIAPHVAEYLARYVVLAYNTRFDLGMIRENMRRCGLPVPRLQGECAMRAYAAFSEHERFVSLERACQEMGIDRTCYGETHRALADALATIDLVMAMRAASRSDLVEEAALVQEEQESLPF